MLLCRYARDQKYWGFTVSGADHGSYHGHSNHSCWDPKHEIWSVLYSTCNAVCVGVVVETSAKTRKDSGGHQQKAFFVLLADTLS